MVASTSGTMPTQSNCPAKNLGPEQRQRISVAVLAGVVGGVKQLSAAHSVSRKFCYEQAAVAQAALSEAFAVEKPDDKILFHLPVTKAWIEQFVHAQSLIGHTSSRGVLELLDCLLDYRDLSAASIHNLLKEAAVKAKAINEAQNLQAVDVGLFDEIYQGKRPVLVGMDAKSTYCFLLSQEDHCDESTWGTHLLELSEKRGLDLDYSIADGGRGFRAGHKAAWGDLPCHGDVFHIQAAWSDVSGFLERRALAAIEACQTLQRRVAAARRDCRVSALQKLRKLQMHLKAAVAEYQRGMQLADDVALLGRWIGTDVLALAGESLPARQMLYDFVTEELKRREHLCPNRLVPLGRAMATQRGQLLDFVGWLDDQWEEIAQEQEVPAYLVSSMCVLAGMNPAGCLYWEKYATLASKLGYKFGPVQAAVKAVLAQTPRCSSMVENLNGRLRHYFSLRRHLGSRYLNLLRFFLNHHRYQRSRRIERVGKSPAQLLGCEHPHWLQMLGYHRFSRN
jgi:hypothetical protein